MRKITENKLEENEIKEKIAKEMGINLASNCQRVESTTYDLDKFIGVTKRTYDKVSRGEREIALDEILLLEVYFNAPCDSF